MDKCKVILDTFQDRPLPMRRKLELRVDVLPTGHALPYTLIS